MPRPAPGGRALPKCSTGLVLAGGRPSLSRSRLPSGGGGLRKSGSEEFSGTLRAAAKRTEVSNCK